jgi:hypothetical protein
MQKKKPPFQVIPNCGVGDVKTGMNLKKCLRNKAGMVLVGQRSRAPQGLFRPVDRGRQTVAAISRPEPNSSVLAPEWCGAIGWFLRDVGADTAALFIELSGEI